MPAPHPPEPGQNVAFYCRYTPSLGGSGIKCSILLPLYPPRPPTAGQDTPIYCHYTPSPGDSGAKCIILSPLYPHARRQRGKTHQFIAIIPPRPVTAGQNASFYHRYTPVPAGGGARHTNLSPLYPLASRQRGKEHQFPTAMPHTTYHASPLIL